MVIILCSVLTMIPAVEVHVLKFNLVIELTVLLLL